MYIIILKTKPQVPLVLLLLTPLFQFTNHHYLLNGLFDIQDYFYSVRNFLKEDRTSKGIQVSSYFTPAKKPRESDSVPDIFENQGFGPQNSA